LIGSGALTRLLDDVIVLTERIRELIFFIGKFAAQTANPICDD
jgi:hypothetical protein